MNRIKRAAILCFAAAALVALCARPGAAAATLKINLVVSDDTVMIYAGVGEGLKVGNRFTVMRGDVAIGTVEIIKVETTYSTAKVVEKTQDLQELDILVTAGGQSAAAGGVTSSAPSASADKGKPATEGKKGEEAAAGGEKADKKTKKDKTKDKKEKKEKKTTKDKKADKKDKSGEETAGGEEGADAKADKKKSKTKDEKAEDKKTGESAAAAATPPATAAKGSFSDAAFPSVNGPTGLFTMPTAFIAAPNKAALAIYRISKEGNSSGIAQDNTSKEVSFSSGISEKINSFAASYGISENLEASFAQVTGSFNADVSVSASSVTESMSVSGSIKSTIFGVKYNPQKKFLLNADTSKKFQYAFGLTRSSVSGDGGDSQTAFYTAVSFPLNRLNIHTNVYKISGGGTGGNSWGSAAGVEIPAAKNVLVLLEVDLFQGRSTYSTGFRYLIGDKAAFTFALYDMTDVNAKLLNLAYKF